MSWRIVAASAAGTSHTATGGECQDSCFASIESASDKDSLLYMFVADGAGSAMRGGKGAELAIEVAAEFFTKQYFLPEFTLHEALAIDCMLMIRRAIDDHTEKEGLRARDYACTFLGLLSFSQSTLVMQIGDGGVVIDIGDGFHVPIEPMSREYANMTYFATDNASLYTQISPPPTH
ncbi:MAG: protein phosphatase 2C domain-containing protein [Candidatus Thiothrix sulfatifontis]|nr:MAG: protein phosphatase 2C domain-containing protein [Candidatus Thiothrix sulfatifontis]